MIVFVKIFVMGIVIQCLAVFSCFPTAWCWLHHIITPIVCHILCYEDIKITFEFAVLQITNPLVLCVVKAHSIALKSSAKSLCYGSCRYQTLATDASATTAIVRCPAVSQISIKPGWMRIWSDIYNMFLLWALYWESVLKQDESCKIHQLLSVLLQLYKF